MLQTTAQLPLGAKFSPPLKKMADYSLYKASSSVKRSIK